MCVRLSQKGSGKQLNVETIMDLSAKRLQDPLRVSWLSLMFTCIAFAFVLVDRVRVQQGRWLRGRFPGEMLHKLSDILMIYFTVKY